MNIRTKLIASFSAVSLVFLASLAATVVEVGRMAELSRVFSEKQWPTANALMELQGALRDVQRSVLTAHAAPDKRALAARLGSAVREARARVEKADLDPATLAPVARAVDKLSANLEAPVLLSSTPGEQMEAADARVQPLLTRLKELQAVELVDATWEAVMGFNDILITGDPAERDNFERHLRTVEASPLFPRFEKEYLPFKAAGREVFVAQEALARARSELDAAATELAQLLESAEKDYETATVNPTASTIAARARAITWVLGASTLVGLLATLVVGWFLSGRLSRTLVAAAGRLQAIAEGEGDLAKTLDQHGSDEVAQLGRHFNVFVGKLRGIVLELKQVSAELSSQSQRVATRTQEIAASNTEVATQLVTVAGSAEEIDTTIQEVARNGERVRESAEKARSAASQGVAVVGKSVEAIRDLIRVVEHAGGAIETLGKETGRVRSVIGVIKDIADQTNLLALNAALEAARAGEQGTGFAVVAQEVRKLAESTKRATQDVTQILGQVVVQSQQAARTIDAGRESVEQGATLATAAGEAIRAIDEHVNVAHAQALEIAGATNRIASSVRVMATNTRQISQAVDANSNAAVEISDASRLVAQFSEAIQGVAGRFQA